jgi:transmembrane sensor
MNPEPASSSASDQWQRQPLEWPRAVGQVDALLAALEIRQRRQRRRRLAAAASVLTVIAVLLGVTAIHSSPATAPTAAPSSSLVIAPERRELPDGTVVELKAGAELAVEFTATSEGPRAVVLRRGEAHFKVTKNPARPFIVTAGGVRFRAVGTAFAVGLESTQVEMLVTEGRVAVESPTGAEPAALVDAGQRVTTSLARSTAPEVVAVSHREADERLGWRVPRLEFNETRLPEVVRLLNEHSGSRIRLSGPGLRDVAISGALRADNVGSLLRMLETSYHIEVVTLPDGEIILRAGRH